MKKREQTCVKRNDESAKHTNAKANEKIELFDIIIAILLTLITIAAALVGFLGESTQNKYLICAISLIILGLITIVLYFRKYSLMRSLHITAREFAREKKMNQISQAVFSSLSQVNSSKARETLRYTYGTVPEWNPIDYQSNVLLYDVHEQIRSILISLKKVVISIDADRFDDQNVSVELVYCYPEEDENKGNLPIPASSGKRTSTAAKTKKNTAYANDRLDETWRLISSGDTSGNHSTVLAHLENPMSFYTLLDYCGVKFVNKKYEPMIEESQIDKVKYHILSTGYTAISNIGTCFFAPDTKDLEMAKDKKANGSVIGAVIGIRNDNPETIFLKAILTINTFGEPIFVEDSASYTNKWWKRLRGITAPVFDKTGLTEEDYKELFYNCILPTYKTLLASELSQMYIRHALRGKKVCPQTGRVTSKEDSYTTLKVEPDCNQCQQEKCKRRIKQCCCDV